MNYNKPTNEDKMQYLLMILNENKGLDPKKQALCYSIFLVRFGTTVPVVYREPAATDIKEQIAKFSSPDNFNPDYIVVQIFTGRSRNVKKPIASYRFDYKFNR